MRGGARESSELWGVRSAAVVLPTFGTLQHSLSLTRSGLNPPDVCPLRQNRTQDTLSA